LPEEDLKEASEKLDALIAQGVVSFNAGRMEEAMEIAESAVASNPTLISALALKGDCHAHRGEIAEAIECYETIVSINPESTLDKIRLNQLRNSLVLTARSVPDRRLAIIGAVAAVVLVGSISAIFARSRAAANPSADIVAVAQEPKTPAEMAQFWQQPTTQETTQKNASANPQPQAPASQAEQEPAPQNRSVPDRGMSLPPAPRGALPGPSEFDPPEIEVRPVTPQLPPGKIGSGGTTTTPTLPPPKQGVDEDPQVDRAMADNRPKENPEDPGTIQIEVRSGKGRTTGTTSTVGSATGVEALVRVARDQYQLGNYSGAANAYEKALSSGGDAISINQRLGQAYERLGRSGDASSAYQRALGAAESAIASGRGDKSRLQAIADSCRQALRVLGN
jgi:tetratricopeptide (TPR) repeat protein